MPDTDGSLILEWARRADQGPFASVGVLDRVAYDSYDPFVALAAAGAVTERVRLVTMIAGIQKKACCASAGVIKTDRANP